MDTRIFDKRKGIFITATGTDMGKTYISALILKHLRTNGLNAGYYKPILSGAYKENNKLILGDAEYVCNFSGLEESPDTLVSYTFETAVSPHLACHIEKKPPIEEIYIMDTYNSIKNKYDFLLVEGCGGIMCPLRIPYTSSLSYKNKMKTLMLPDIIKLLDLDIIIIADAGLGTINSVLLTVEYANSRNINIIGIILNHYDEKNFLHRDNKKQIEFLTKLPVLECVPTACTEI